MYMYLKIGKHISLLFNLNVVETQGVNSLETVNLRRNLLSTIHENAFVEMSGSAGTCGTGLRECYLDLMENDLELVEGYGFAWIQYMDIYIGDGLKVRDQCCIMGNENIYNQ